jgi:hypothetical protein
MWASQDKKKLSPILKIEYGKLYKDGRKYVVKGWQRYSHKGMCPSNPSVRNDLF